MSHIEAAKTFWITKMMQNELNMPEILAEFASAQVSAKDSEIRNLKSLNSALESDNANNSMNLEHLSSQLSEKDAHFIEHAKSEAQVIEDLRYCNAALKAEIKRLRDGLENISTAFKTGGKSVSPTPVFGKNELLFRVEEYALGLLSPADGDANRLEDMLEETAPDGYEIVTFTKKKSDEH